MLERQIFGWVGLAIMAVVTGCSGMSGDDEVSSSSIDGSYPGSYYPPTGTGGAATYPTSAPDEVVSPSNEGDQYETVGTNPFVLTAHDPLSTFAADVDTASYDIFRRDINLGMRPQPASVRLEEYVNYFEYDYPMPPETSPVPFSIHLDAAPNILERDTVMLRVGVQGQAGAEFIKRPTNLVFLVDASGSMGSADKLPLVQQVLRETLTVLDPDDTVSIVTYASGTSVRLEPTPVSDPDTIRDVIDSLSSGGATAGADGLNLAYSQAESAFLEGGINHVLLCTDGDFNVGPSSTDAMLSLIQQKRETGITLTVLGFGVGNLNDEMMEAVSNAGNGVYGVIADPDQAQSYVHERLLSTMTFIAKDVRLQVEFNPNEVYAYRLLGYENRAVVDEQFRDDTLDAGEIGAEHRVTALYELVLSGREVPSLASAPPPEDGDAYAGAVEIAGSDLVLVKIRYKHPDATVDDPAQEVAATLTPADLGESYAAMDADFQWAVAVAAYAEILKESPFADAALLPQIEGIVTSSVYGSDPDRTEFAALVEHARPLLGY